MPMASNVLTTFTPLDVSNEMFSSLSKSICVDAIAMSTRVAR